MIYKVQEFPIYWVFVCPGIPSNTCGTLTVQDISGLDPEHVLVGQEAAHASLEVLVAAVEGPGGAGCVPSLIPELLPEQSWAQSCQLSILVMRNESEAE